MTLLQTPASRLRQGFCALVVLAASAVPAAQAQMPAGWGAYHWGGAQGATALERLAGAQEQLTAQGFSTARLVISPRMRNGNPVDNPYGLQIDATTPGCALDDDFLPCAIRLPAYQAAITAPALRTVVLTAYDAASMGARGEAHRYLEPAFWRVDANRAAVQREYRELTLALYQTQQRSGKTFVIASWEADNQAYCGAFVRYAEDAVFRSRCGEPATRAAAIGALREWFSVRQAGIREGRASAAQAGLTGVTVADGVEFNVNTLTYRYAVDGTALPSVLRDIVPAVQPDVVLYSAYDSQNRGTMEPDLRQIRSWLAQVAPAARLGVGEFGHGRQGADFADAARLLATANAVLRVGLPIVVIWAAFDPPADAADRAYGLLDAGGRPRQVMTLLQRCLRTGPSPTDVAAAAPGRLPADHCQ
jgi:hypothetical protein